MNRLLSKAKLEQPEHVLEYIKVFGKKPNVIGMYWRYPEQVEENIKNAILSGVEYDELNLLPEKEREEYLRGALFF